MADLTAHAQWIAASLERIAVAQERIAVALEAQKAPPHDDNPWDDEIPLP
jgi:DNA-binding transcriptional regulator LsrR (DeoR family)